MKMLLLCGIAATAFFGAKAQISFGVKFGVNTSTYGGTDAGGPESKLVLRVPMSQISI
jgi:hypothetical protein